MDDELIDALLDDIGEQCASEGAPLSDRERVSLHRRLEVLRGLLRFDRDIIEIGWVNLETGQVLKPTRTH